MGQLTLHPLAEQLAEAVVKGRRPTVRTKGSKTTVDVKNSVLSDMGSVKDMLEYVPGLMPDGSGGVKVPGRGRPLIEIDGREVTQQSLLDVLKSDTSGAHFRPVRNVANCCLWVRNGGVKAEIWLMKRSVNSTDGNSRVN